MSANRGLLAGASPRADFAVIPLGWRLSDVQKLSLRLPGRGQLQALDMGGFVTNSIASRTMPNGTYRQAAAQAAVRHSVKA